LQRRQLIQYLAVGGSIAALNDFDNYSGALKPHFAFGMLSKSDYALAHVLHINNHLQEFAVI